MVWSLGAYLIWFVLGTYFLHSVEADSSRVTSFRWGFGIGFFNLCYWSVIMQMFVRKKFVALAFALSVSKYAIIAGLVYYLVIKTQFEPLGFVGGLAGLGISIAIMHFIRVLRS